MILDVLIFGCTGQDGSFLSKSLIKKGLNVLGVTRRNQPNLKNLDTLSIKNELEIIKGDLTNIEEIKKILETYKPKRIYNLSAQSSVGISLEKPLSTSKSIVDATINLLEACRVTDYQGNIFFAGSSEIYGETNEPAAITSNKDIRSPYALAKYQSYLQVKLYREIYNLRSVTGVLFNHESILRSKNFVTQKIVNGAIRCMHEKSQRLRLGNLNIIRDWGCAEEYVEGMQVVTNASCLKDQVICSGRAESLKEIVDIVFTYLNMNWRDYVITDEQYSRKSDARISIGNPNMLEKDLQWKAKVTIEQVLHKMIEHSLKNINTN